MSSSSSHLYSCSFTNPIIRVSDVTESYRSFYRVRIGQDSKDVLFRKMNSTLQKFGHNTNVRHPFSLLIIHFFLRHFFLRHFDGRQKFCHGRANPTLPRKSKEEKFASKRTEANRSPDADISKQQNNANFFLQNFSLSAIRWRQASSPFFPRIVTVSSPSFEPWQMITFQKPPSHMWKQEMMPPLCSKFVVLRVAALSPSHSLSLLARSTVDGHAFLLLPLWCRGSHSDALYFHSVFPWDCCDVI